MMFVAYDVCRSAVEESSSISHLLRHSSAGQCFFEMKTIYALCTVVLHSVIFNSVELGLTLEFLSYKILENFMRNEFCISRKILLVSRNFVLRETGFSMQNTVSYFAKQSI